MNKQQLFENIKRKKSFLCVGLDTDIKKIPEHLLKEEDPIFAFNKAIIDAAFMDGDIQDCIDHLIVAENAERLKESEL